MVGIIPLMDEDQQLEADARELFDPATDIPDWYVDDEYERRVQAEIDAELDARRDYTIASASGVVIAEVRHIDIDADDVPF